MPLISWLPLYRRTVKLKGLVWSAVSLLTTVLSISKSPDLRLFTNSAYRVFSRRMVIWLVSLPTAPVDTVSKAVMSGKVALSVSVPWVSSTQYLYPAGMPEMVMISPSARSMVAVPLVKVMVRSRDRVELCWPCLVRVPVKLSPSTASY